MEPLVLFAGTIISRSILGNRGHSHVPVFDYTSVGRWLRIFDRGTWLMSIRHQISIDGGVQQMMDTKSYVIPCRTNFLAQPYI